MKKLQNNFTTPEQSNRLLELGIPEWTSDCYYYNPVTDQSDIYVLKKGRTIIDQQRLDCLVNNPAICLFSCWSVGRLIEIYVYLTSYEYVSLIFKKTFTPMDKILNKLEKDIKNGMLDFSKLED